MEQKYEPLLHEVGAALQKKIGDDCKMPVDIAIVVRYGDGEEEESVEVAYRGNYIRLIGASVMLQKALTQNAMAGDSYIVEREDDKKDKGDEDRDA